MYRYRGMRDGLHRVEDTEDGAIDVFNDTELREALLIAGQIEGLSFDEAGNIVDDFGVICSKAPVIKKNKNLHEAKRAKNDEFYTQLPDIEKELSRYSEDTFKDKVIYLPMDVAVNTGATMQSQFVKYFQLNAHRLQFKKLIATCLVERAAGEGESLEQVQNCYVLERVTVPSDQRNIWGYTHGFERNNPVTREFEDFGLKYDTVNGMTHSVPYHVVNQAVTDAGGRIVLVKKYIDHYDEVDGHPVLSDEFTGKTWVWGGHQLKIKWCRKHPDGTIEMLPNECYFFNNNDIFSDFGIFPKDEEGNPCFESVDGGSVCLYPPEYYDFRESDYTEYSMHCPEDAGEHGGSGDFRSEYCKQLLAECDIVVTNPPFSLFRDFFAWLIASKKKFIIIGNQNAFNYKEVFPFIQDNKVWTGFGFKGLVGFFRSPYKDYAVSSDHRDGLIRVSGVCWFTNCELSKRHEVFVGLSKAENEANGVVYRKYDNYEAINIDRTEQIPMDYDGVMGVPITFLHKYNPEQFEILGLSQKVGFGLCSTKDYSEYEETMQNGDVTGSSGKKINGNPVLSGMPSKGNFFVHPVSGDIVYSLYGRIFIRRRNI